MNNPFSPLFTAKRAAAYEARYAHQAHLDQLRAASAQQLAHDARLARWHALATRAETAMLAGIPILLLLAAMCR